MKNNVVISIPLIFALLLASCVSKSRIELMQQELNELAETKDATIGIAVIIDGKDTVAVNGHRHFPMLSVYKFPIALAFGDHLRTSNTFLPENVTLTKNDLKPDTHSPMRDKYAEMDTIRTGIQEIMAYSLQHSDNNASDIILGLMGGTNNVKASLHRLNAFDINIVSTEAEMHESPDLCYKNSSTPIAMAKLIDMFDRKNDDPFSREIKHLMETSSTGENRLAKPLVPAKAIIGHKTGTGFTLPNGRLLAVNDAGYVHLPDGHRYSIAVFIENSGYNMDETEKIIADISEIVLSHLKKIPVSETKNA